MKSRVEDNKSIGVYCIYNKINNKRYIGVSINIGKRIISQKCNLNQSNKKRVNDFLIKEWHEFGSENFDYLVLERIESKDRKFLLERELYWMDFYRTCESEFGYNLRRDSSEGMELHELTRKKMSASHKKRYENKEVRLQFGEKSRKFWKENPEVKEQMKRKLQKLHSKYEFHQFDKVTNELIKVWESISDVMDANPTYKKHNIYAVCSGEKPSIYGYKWCKYLKKV